MPYTEARGPILWNLNIYHSLDAGNPKEGDKSWMRQVPPSEVGNSWGETLRELSAANTPGNWEIKWSMKEEGGDSAPQPPTGVKTHCQQVILFGLINMSLYFPMVTLAAA